MIPGASCLATIVLSLRDKTHSTAEALLKVALMGLKPWAESFGPSGAVKMPELQSLSWENNRTIIPKIP
jgi:hypothetical protein